MPQEAVDTWFYGNTYDEDAEELIPELMVWGELVVSERVKDLIQSFAPNFCYLSPMKLIGQKTGAPHPTPYFKVLVRQVINYIGSTKRPRRRQTTDFRPLSDENWSALCENEGVIRYISRLPISLSSRGAGTPILNAALYRHLKAHNGSGLIEYIDYPEREHLFAVRVRFEAAIPLRPGPDVPLS